MFNYNSLNGFIKNANTCIFQLMFKLGSKNKPKNHDEYDELQQIGLLVKKMNLLYFFVF